jgi:predicted nucleic acid-binding protein
MSKPKRPKYCWDTTVFLAWISEEEGQPLDDIGLVADEIDADRADLVVSAIVYSEVLEAKHNKREIKQFQRFLKRSNVIAVDMTVGIAQKASDIRSKAFKAKQRRNLKSPDAIIAATAIIYGADVLHSFDPHLLTLHGSAIVDSLKITPPRLITGQKALPGIIAPADRD